MLRTTQCDQVLGSVVQLVAVAVVDDMTSRHRSMRLLIRDHCSQSPDVRFSHLDKRPPNAAPLVPGTNPHAADGLDVMWSVSLGEGSAVRVRPLVCRIASLRAEPTRRLSVIKRLPALTADVVRHRSDSTTATAGSGTTLLVATGYGHDAIGIDLDERNAELALERVGPFLLEVVA